MKAFQVLCYEFPPVELAVGSSVFLSDVPQPETVALAAALLEEVTLVFRVRDFVVELNRG
jgi:hypothetical protein